LHDAPFHGKNPAVIRKKDALEYHSTGRRGKIEVVPSKPLLTQRDLSLAYTPGVAEPCLEIARDPETSYTYTSRGNLVAVISNGTAVLGLGDIGAQAAKPVMEGKGCLFKKFADIDVFDIEVDAKNPDDFIRVVAALEPTFGGINLEDVKAPECFYIEAELKKRMQIPVFHDDQHGTAIISGAALLNALEVQKKDVSKIRLVVSGAGASAIACANYYVSLGVRRENVMLVDSTGVVSKARAEGMNPYKAAFAVDTRARTLADALKDADVFLGCSKGGLMTPAMVQSMAPRPIVFALANPDPEISYADAAAARDDVVVATGRSDFPNQVNNVLGFPFIFRGALDVRAREINEAMKLAASRALAKLAKEDVPEAVSAAYGNQQFRYGRDYLIPKPFDQRVLWWVAPAVAQAAIDTGVARQVINIEEYRESLRRQLAGHVHVVMRGIVLKAKAQPRRIVFPEGDHPKILRAAQIVVDEGIALPILLGSRDQITRLARDMDLEDLPDRVDIVTPREFPKYDEYVQQYFERRQRKGSTMEHARRMMARRNPFGMMMVNQGDADGVVTGVSMAYPETIRPALEIIGVRPGVKKASGMYMMVYKHDVKFFADATVNIDPDAETLAETAILCADAVRDFDITPHVALLSFSNFGGARHPESERAAKAVELVRQRRPDIEIDGEMQADVALDYKYLKENYPFCRLTDEANVLVFPSLSAGNVAYKIMGRWAGAEPVGPILLGVRKPVAVLPRNSSVPAIVNMTAFTVMKARSGDVTGPIVVQSSRRTSAGE
jgi:malate dehydrogenase (oxaloacetate-decarboxylating)(NADP+)